MKIVLERAVFQTSSRDLDVIALFQEGNRTRFHLMLAADAHQDYELWLARQTPSVADDCQILLEMGMDLEAREPSLCECRIIGSGSSTWTDTPRISINDALTFCRTPFSIVVENAVNDRNFILAVAGADARRRIEALERDASIQFKNGGGLGTMRQTAHHEIQREPNLRWRTWALFDSDAREPRSPSRASELMRTLCVDHGIKFHQLRRRSIENYIPLTALKNWVYEDRSRKKSKAPALHAFYNLSDPQKHHFNMKSGFGGDRPQISSLYAALDQQDILALEHGFGKTVAEDTFALPLSYQDLIGHGVHDEMEPVLAFLLSFIC